MQILLGRTAKKPPEYLPGGGLSIYQRIIYFFLLDFFCLFFFSQPAKHSLLHRTKDIFISRASAQMPGHQLADLIIREFSLCLQNFYRAHDKSRAAESALYCCFINKCLLDIRYFPVWAGKALQSQYFLSLCPHRKINAGVKALSIYQHIAGSALTYFTALFDTRKPVIIPKHIGQGRTNVYHFFYFLSVDGTGNQFILSTHLPHLLQDEWTLSTRALPVRLQCAGGMLWKPSSCHED